jgi:hypothetical protein
MNTGTDLNVFTEALDEFLRADAEARPTAQTNHGNAQAWRLAEEGPASKPARNA